MGLWTLDHSPAWPQLYNNVFQIKQRCQITRGRQKIKGKQRNLLTVHATTSKIVIFSLWTSIVFFFPRENLAAAGEQFLVVSLLLSPRPQVIQNDPNCHWAAALLALLIHHAALQYTSVFIWSAARTNRDWNRWYLYFFAALNETLEPRERFSPWIGTWDRGLILALSPR